MNVSDYVTSLQHIGMPTKNIDETLSFYQRLGFKVIHIATNPENGAKVAFLALHDLIIETYEQINVSVEPGVLDHIALNVSDIDAAFRILSKSGLKLLDQQINSLPFWSKGVRFFTVEGPNKEKIEFCQIVH